MKHILKLLFAFCLTQNLSGQISNCNVSPILQNYYDQDVKHLALERIIFFNSPYKDSIIIPPSFQDTIMQGLAAIFNSSFPERDSIFDHHCIHDNSFFHTIFHRINVHLDTNYTWTHNWINNNITTGISALDYLISTYGFTIDNFLMPTILILSTSQNINMQPVCDSLVTFPGITLSDIVSVYGEGNIITYSCDSSLNRYYNFDLQWSDCLAGCLCNHRYRFMVDNNCSVQYLGTSHSCSTGDPMPSPVYCNISTGVNTINHNLILNIFPNPVSGDNILHIECETIPEKIQIIDKTGRIIFQDNPDKTISLIDCGAFANDIYFLKAKFKSGAEITHKIIKY